MNFCRHHSCKHWAVLQHDGQHWCAVVGGNMRVEGEVPVMCSEEKASSNELPHQCLICTCSGCNMVLAMTRALSRQACTQGRLAQKRGPRARSGGRRGEGERERERERETRCVCSTNLLVGRQHGDLLLLLRGETAEQLLHMSLLLRLLALLCLQRCHLALYCSCMGIVQQRGPPGRCR